MNDIKTFISGFRRFRQKYFGTDHRLFDELRQAQRPKALVVACCDSRVDPALLTDCDPGDIFVVRSIANLVPPYEPGGRYPGTRAAIEFGVRQLGIEHIIVLGHAECGGIRALMEETAGEFVPSWVSIAERARSEALSAFPHAAPAARFRACEQAAILLSLENLLGYPWIQEKVAAGSLALHGWYFDIAAGELLGYDAEAKRFGPLPGARREP